MMKVACLICMGAAALLGHEWSGADYHTHSSEQRAAGERLLDTMTFAGNEEVLDVGCGDGFLTSLLAKRVPAGSVVGIDLSQSMIEFASKTFASDKLSFRVLDANLIDYEKRFDLITSFTVLQWVPDQLPVLKRIERALRKGGRLFVEMPNKFPEPLAHAIQKVTTKEEWKGYFEGFSTGMKFFGTTEYKDLLEAAGLKLVRIEQFLQSNTFPNRKAFTGFLSQWFPYLRAVPDEKKGEFIDQIVDAYLDFLPPDGEGKPLFFVRRLRVQAQKP